MHHGTANIGEVRRPVRQTAQVCRTGLLNKVATPLATKKRYNVSLSINVHRLTHRDHHTLCHHVV